MELFRQLLQAESISEEDLVLAESFFCQMYGKTGYGSIDEARLDMFMKKCQPKKNENIISSIKKMNGSSLPLCKRIVQHFPLIHLVLAQRSVADSCKKVLTRFCDLKMMLHHCLLKASANKMLMQKMKGSMTLMQWFPTFSSGDPNQSSLDITATQISSFIYMFYVLPVACKSKGQVQ